MLKINLLPLSIRQRGRVKKAKWAAAFLALATAGGFLHWNHQLQVQAQTLQTEITSLTPTKQEAERLKAEADRIRGEIGPITQQVQFIEQVLALPEQWISIVDNAVQYTHASIPINSLTIAGEDLTMQGETPNLRTAARYYLNALRNPEWKSVTINGPGGYPGNATPADMHPRFGRVGYGLQIAAKLAKPVTVPSPGGGSGGPPQGSPDMMGGAPPSDMGNMMPPPGP